MVIKIRLILCIAVVLSVSFLFTITKVYSDGTYSSLGTGDAADGSADAINFSQGRVWTIDKFGKYIWMTQNRSGPTSHWAWSNDAGTNWSQGSESYTFLTRASVAYDSNNDKLHVIWAATDSNDGIIYRRYGITRDGSNNITAITREDSSNINLQLDTSSSRTLEQPVALWVDDGSANGILVAVWAKNGGSMAEIRASMRKLSLSAADGNAANWVALDGNGDTFATDAPAVEADKIYTSATGSSIASATVRGGSDSRKDDMYIFVAESETSSVLAYRGIWNSGSSDWGGGWQSPVTVGEMDNDGGGYNLKFQLITKPVLDIANDRLYVGWARWKDGINGDTVSLAYLDGTDTPSSTIDVYSALGTHSYAPTVDIAFDNTLGQLYVAYVESTTNGDNGSIDYKTYDGTSLSGSTRFYTSPGGTAGADGGADIPILYESRSSNNRLLFAFRVNGALPPTVGDPHTLSWGYLPLAVPTATPTPTPTTAPTGNQNGVSPDSHSSTQTPVCTTTRPANSPTLFQIDVTATNATIYFTPISSNVDKYFVAFGYTAGDNRFGAEIHKGVSSGVLSYTINHLSANTTYYIRLRGENGCMPGDWGNEMKFTTAKSASKEGVRYYKDFASRIASYFPINTTSVGAPSTCEYTVKSGDSLWRIASNFLGSGIKYSILMQQNSLVSTILRIGQVVKLGC